MRYEVEARLSYDVVRPTTFVFNIEAARLPRQTVLSEQLAVSSDAERSSYAVPNDDTRYLRLVAAPDQLTLHYAAKVELNPVRADPATIEEIPAAAIPLAYFPYLLPSRFVPSDRLADFAIREFGAVSPGHARVTEICNWINASIAYQPGSSDSETIASETLLKRAGVCRDFAHLGVAFCRALGIPARFVSCYAFGLVPPDFHAVFEAYLSGRWWLFDATRQANLDGLVRIGVGRDASDVAFATPIGEMNPGPVEVSINRIGDVTPSERTTDAISLSD